VVIDDGSDDDFRATAASSSTTRSPPEPPERDFGERSADDIYILYTGGTTGFPKGVMWRHEDIWRVLGGGIDFAPASRVDEYDRQSGRPGTRR
jgi:long-subunit acyl-CoA synthetase (AMP-forming)